MSKHQASKPRISTFILICALSVLVVAGAFAGASLLFATQSDGHNFGVAFMQPFARVLATLGVLIFVGGMFKRGWEVGTERDRKRER